MLRPICYVISQWHKEYRFVVGFLEEMEATVAFSPLENWGSDLFDASKPLGFNPAQHQANRDQTSTAPAAPRGSSEGTSPSQQPRAQRKQAAGPAAPIHREDRLPANKNPYAPRAARTEAGILGCDGCGREGHAAEPCFCKRHPNWNTQHATVKRKDSAIAKEIRLLANGYLRSLPPDGVQWLPDDKLWIGGEKLIKAWKAKLASFTNRSHDAKSAQGNPPDQNRGKIFHLGVARGSTDVYPSVQGTLASRSMNSPTKHIFVECLLDTGCLFANFIKADIARQLGTQT
jgi:hypothetical protein